MKIWWLGQMRSNIDVFFNLLICRTEHLPERPQTPAKKHSTVFGSPSEGKQYLYLLPHLARSTRSSWRRVAVWAIRCDPTPLQGSPLVANIPACGTRCRDSDAPWLTFWGHGKELVNQLPSNSDGSRAAPPSLRSRCWSWNGLCTYVDNVVLLHLSGYSGSSFSLLVLCVGSWTASFHHLWVFFSHPLHE